MSANKSQKLRKYLSAYVIQMVIVVSYEMLLLYKVVQGLEDDAESFHEEIRRIFSFVVCLMFNVN